MSLITMLLQTPFSSSILLQRTTTIHYASPKYFCSARLVGNVEFNTTTREYIKPSSPTPHHLKTYKLSVLDQLAPPFHMPVLLFYPPSNGSCVEERLLLLKNALSETLTRFYPLAGRIKNQYVVDCNDDGALYIEVKIRREMMDCLQPPKNEFLHQLFPCQLISKQPLETNAQVAIQSNVFACGGIALAICFLHKLVDGGTFAAFLKAWAQIARGSLNQEIHNVVDNIAASLFPTNELCLTTRLRVVEYNITSFAKEGRRRSIMKRFAFNSNTISMLKEKARSEQVQNPTATEVITGIIWKCSMNAYKAKTGNERSSALKSFVNLRQRLNPRLPHHSIGNIIWPALANYDPTLNMNMELLPRMVSLLRKSIDQVNTDFFPKLQGEERVTQLLKSLEEQNQNSYCDPIEYLVSSVSKMGFYEVDFGWGKPLWFTIGPSIEVLPTNLIYQVETRNGNGIEALIVLDEDEMEILVNDQEFTAYATLNPVVKPQRLESFLYASSRE